MRYYIIAGEASGDMYGALLMRTLLERDPKAKFRFWGGNRMAEVGGTPVRHIRDLAVMGFIEVLRHLPTISRNMAFCKRDIEDFMPDVVVGIDYPGFNLRIEGWAKRHGFRTLHFISPNLWAWKKGRINGMRRSLDRLCYILPFEERFFAENNMPQAVYVGHPILDLLTFAPQAPSSASQTIALLPGSRRQEIKNTLPKMVELARRYPQYRFVVAGMSLIGSDFYESIVDRTENVCVKFDCTYDVLRSAGAAIVCSGTATLETALIGVPQVVCYAGNRLSYIIARAVVGRRIKYISLVNLIADRPVVTELIQDDFNMERLDKEFCRITEDKENRERMMEEYADVRTLLGGGGATLRTAEETIAVASQSGIGNTPPDPRQLHVNSTSTPRQLHVNSTKMCSGSGCGGVKKMLMIVLTTLLAFTASAERVRVRLFTNNTIRTLNVSFDLGYYNLYADGNLIEDMVGEGRSVLVGVDGDRLHLSVNEDDYGNFSSLRLEATDTACILCLNPEGGKQRTYEGNLDITVARSGSMLLVADVEFETYIAGVVQSEIYGSQSDIFRIQAIISRTWALRNMRKHASSGYNFCDGVHCQAYFNRCIRPDIMLGVIQSSGQTLVDADGNLIETPFHSNSGGQTANSEDVWRTALPYLRSVTDTFSYRMRQSEWVKTYSVDKWLGYFSRTHKLNTQDPAVRDSLLHFTQNTRQVRLLGIPLTRIRADLQLKSTFFSVEYDEKGKNVTLRGHGYGHGVGLSQEGAIRMVGLGIAYDSILHHYYTGALLHLDPNCNTAYISDYAGRIADIISEDNNTQTQHKSKKDDWLGRLFRLRDREERQETYIEEDQDIESNWQYEW